jgi:hypothetical protein
VNEMPYVQTSVTKEELAELHSLAIMSSKPVQRLVYEFIKAGLDKKQLEDKANVGRKTSEKTGKGN